VSRTLLVMAAGTGGHVYPGLSIAGELAAQGWRIVWLGTPDGIENTLVAKAGYPLERIAFSGLRGKGLLRWLLLPLNLLRAFWQCWRVMLRVKPDVALGMGGYVTFPGGMMAVLYGAPLVIHESNAVSGLANRVLAVIADRVLVGFPNAYDKPIRNALPKLLPKPGNAQWLGNPVRAEIAAVPVPAQRYAGRSGPLRVLVVGGSLGAQGMNKLVVEALAAMAASERPEVVHQSGAKLFDELKALYAATGVTADVLPYLDDMAARYTWCDVIVCRAGAMTVAEVAAAGVAAIFIPLPYAVEDEQSHNAAFLADQGAARIAQQKDTSPQQLADLLRSLTREALQAMAEKARALGKPHATMQCAAECSGVAR
jgi:UDP-N-acetylglucosamine--N-acetylmuramyl-(pentapeptide) pyrophosphoryl-undecaprenol N-acetylglucosamine transferase